jgi:hypothetical protein
MIRVGLGTDCCKVNERLSCTAFHLRGPTAEASRRIFCLTAELPVNTIMEKAPLVPSVVSYYDILKELGQGGMGVVCIPEDARRKERLSPQPDSNRCYGLKSWSRSLAPWFDNRIIARACADSSAGSLFRPGRTIRSRQMWVR